MAWSASSPMADRLFPDKVAYWYFRLNGFLQIENFVVHPEGRGSQRTDADLLAVQFPHRAERLFDNPNDIMPDDERRLSLSRKLIDVVIAEVKKNQRCALNGPWTAAERENVQRVLAAIGCMPHELIDQAAAGIYSDGGFELDNLRIRLIAVGMEKNLELAKRFAKVVQVTWPQILGFIWKRFDKYQHQKTQVEQWDQQGLSLKSLARKCGDAEDFISKALPRMW